MAVKSKRLRLEILKRDRFTCLYCGRRPPQVVLHVDHIVAEANGGTDEPPNLTTSCADCNLGKGARPLDAVLPAVDYERELLRREQAKELAQFLLEERREHEETADRLLTFWDEIGGDCPGRFRQAVASIICWLKEGLIEVELQALMEEATRRCGEWRYFCGCCWRTLKRRRGEAV